MTQEIFFLKMDLTYTFPFSYYLARFSDPITIQIYKKNPIFPNYTIGNPARELVVEGSGLEFLATNPATNASCDAPLGCLTITPL